MIRIRITTINKGLPSHPSLFLSFPPSPLSMTCFTHHGAAPKACFQAEPSVWVQTNTVHSTHTKNTPHYKREKEYNNDCMARIREVKVHSSKEKREGSIPLDISLSLLLVQSS
jgi:hypothetical protein